MQNDAIFAVNFRADVKRVGNGGEVTWTLFGEFGLNEEVAIVGLAVLWKGVVVEEIFDGFFEQFVILCAVRSGFPKFFEGRP